MAKSITVWISLNADLSTLLIIYQNDVVYVGAQQDKTTWGSNWF
jgi:hypothetical protein